MHTKVNLIKQYGFIILILFILHINKYIQCESTEKNSINNHDNSNIYSSLKANEFLTYDKCMQRMKCPVTRQEECSEECQEGNTEEEIEEHQELTVLEKPLKNNRKFKTKLNSNKQTNPSKQNTDL